MKHLFLYVLLGFQLHLSGRIGCAYYEPATRILYVLEDTQEASHFDLTRMCKMQFELEACILRLIHCP